MSSMRIHTASFCALLLLFAAIRQDASINKGPRTPPGFTRPPVIYKNPNPSVPMAAIVEFATDRPVRARLLLDEGDSERSLAAWKSYGTEYFLPVLGLRAGTKNSITLVVSDRLGYVVKWSLEFTTEPLPADFPLLELAASQPQLMEPGITLFDVFKPGTLSYGLLVAVDEYGEVVWYYRSDETISDVRRMKNGHLLFLDVTGAGEIDMLGNIVQRWHPTGHGNTGRGISTPVNTEVFHHEIYETISGHFLGLSTELRRLPDYPASETNATASASTANVVGDLINEFTRDGTIVNQWSLFDMIDPYRIGFDSLGATWNGQYPEADGGTKDWTHANAVIQDPADDSVIVSIRHQDALIKFDRKTGALIWILGDPEGWNSPWNRYVLSPEGDLQWPYHQHAPMITPQGTMLLFDNGNRRHRPFDQRLDQNYSRAVEYAVDSERMTVSQVWSYGGPTDGEMFYSNALGDADWMPLTGNVLITDGSRLTTDVPGRRFARIVEVTRTRPAEKVFELLISDAPGLDSIGRRVYRSERLSSLYPMDSISDESLFGERPKLIPGNVRCKRRGQGVRSKVDRPYRAK